jgi:predicted ATPase/signal transduction histidine kinase
VLRAKPPWPPGPAAPAPGGTAEGSSAEGALLLRQDAELALWRRGASAGRPSVLVLTTLGDPVPVDAVARLRREHELRAELEDTWAVRPLALVDEQGRAALELSDPGGELLSERIGEPLELEAFLRIARAIARALAHVHARQLIHKDVKPANVFVDAAHEVRLTGFGFAARSSRELRAEPPSRFEGTLEFMAPEQTGRMNRSIDARSDLYALGVSAYQLLTGALPFSATSALEWVHCHIARAPVPVSEHRSDVPPTVARVVMKLLAKAPEGRYQTALGLEADLQRCLSEWEQRGAITDFALGAHDVPERLVLPERLYGRSAPVAELCAAFERVCSCGASELVLVAGPAGIGKSSVVGELRRTVSPGRALFASGKFDQYKRDIPYATVVEAFQGLVSGVLGEPELELARWREALRQALGPNGHLLVGLVPELELVIGRQPPPPELPPPEAQLRFQTVFRRFVGVFARPERPLVLFLDDLQWLDPATLELVQHSLLHDELGHLLLIAAYRSDEVGREHPLSRALSSLRDAGARIHEIALGPLEHAEVVQLVSDTIRCEPEAAASLAGVVLDKTGGNPFFTSQFLGALCEERLLDFDPSLRRWRWDIERIVARAFTDNVAALMIAKLTRLPPATQQALKLFACLGSSATVETLCLVLDVAEDELHAALAQAFRAGLVSRLDGAYRFLHDRVHEAAYELASGERPAVHLRIGRLLAARAAIDRREADVFETVNQLNRGASLLVAADEREQVAEHNLLAGKQAKSAAAYATAHAYFAAGTALLDDQSWRRGYALSFELALQCAQCEYVLGNLALAEQRLAELAERVASLEDHAAVARARIELYTSKGSPGRAIEIGLTFLARVGVHWSAHPSDEDVRLEYELIWRRLGSRAIEDIASLGEITEPAIRATLDLLAALHAPANFIDANLLALTIGHMVNVSLEHGNSDGSCLAYVYVGMILQSRFGDYASAFRFGRLGVALVERGSLDRFRSLVYLNFGNAINPWSERIGTSLELLRSARDTARERGELTCAAYSYTQALNARLALGAPLSEVQQEAEEALAFVEQSRFGIGIAFVLGQLGMVRGLRGLSARLSSFSSGQLDEERFERQLEHDAHLAMAACWYWIRKLQAHVIAGEHGAALTAASKARALLWTSPGFLIVAEYHLYAALAHSGARAPRDDVRSQIDVHRRQFEIWARRCPANFADRLALVDAELARVEGRLLDAEREYERAVQLARAHGFVQNEGLASERAGLFYAGRGLETVARAYLAGARDCYGRWGAERKLQELEQSWPFLRRAERSSASSLQQLDLATVLEVSQTVAQELALDRVIGSLMTTALEQAGAQRGLLLLARSDELEIAAEARSPAGVVTVELRRGGVTGEDLPLSLLNYASRTRHSVLIDDAGAPNPFAHDPYIASSGPRSVLCLPLLKRARLIGLLYLENGLTPYAFTPTRFAVLELLASQSALSLENARLYSELESAKIYMSHAERLGQTGTFSWKPETGEIFWSDEMFRIFDATGTPTLELIRQRAHPDDMPILESIIADASRLDHEVFEYRLLLPDRSVKHITVTAHRVGAGPDGAQYVGAVRDVTEMKRSQVALQTTQAALADLTRVASLGEMAAAIAHEVNQPLAAIRLNASTCLRRLQDGQRNIEEAQNAASRIARDATRAADVIRRLRELFARAGGSRAPVDVNEAMREVIALTRSQVQRVGAVVRSELGEGLPLVLGDRVQLQQVMMNLVVNAAEALRDVGERAREITLRTTHESGHVRVEVRDTGAGVPPEQLERIFAPFYTTKLGGMGMGLSICRTIVESHGGKLSFEAGGGATFAFTIPSG